MTPAEWEAWFRRIFSELATVGADTDSEILDYQSLAATHMGFAVVEFRQSLGI